jgi:hypothetical protein
MILIIVKTEGRKVWIFLNCVVYQFFENLYCSKKQFINILKAPIGGEVEDNAPLSLHDYFILCCSDI